MSKQTEKVPSTPTTPVVGSKKVDIEHVFLAMRKEKVDLIRNMIKKWPYLEINKLIAKARATVLYAGCSMHNYEMVKALLTSETIDVNKGKVKKVRNVEKPVTPLQKCCHDNWLEGAFLLLYSCPKKINLGIKDVNDKIVLEYNLSPQCKFMLNEFSKLTKDNFVQKYKGFYERPELFKYELWRLLFEYQEVKSVIHQVFFIDKESYEKERENRIHELEKGNSDLMDELVGLKEMNQILRSALSKNSDKAVNDVLMSHKKMELKVSKGSKKANVLSEKLKDSDAKNRKLLEIMKNANIARAGEKLDFEEKIEKINAEHEKEVKELKESKRKVFDNGKMVIKKLEKMHTTLEERNKSLEYLEKQNRIFRMDKQEMSSRLGLKIRSIVREYNRVLKEKQVKIVTAEIQGIAKDVKRLKEEIEKYETKMRLAMNEKHAIGHKPEEDLIRMTRKKDYQILICENLKNMKNSILEKLLLQEATGTMSVYDEKEMNKFSKILVRFKEEKLKLEKKKNGKNGVEIEDVLENIFEENPEKVRREQFKTISKLVENNLEVNQFPFNVITFENPKDLKHYKVFKTQEKHFAKQYGVIKFVPTKSSIVLEKASTLFRFVRRNLLDDVLKTKFCLSIAQSLKAIHEKKRSHLNLSCHSVFIRSKMPILGDLRNMKELSNEGSEKYGKKELYSPYFTDPDVFEAIKSEKNTNHLIKQDVYSFGMTMCFIFFDRIPFKDYIDEYRQGDSTFVDDDVPVRINELIDEEKYKEILFKSVNGKSKKNDKAAKLISDCIQPLEDERPSVSAVIKRVNEILKEETEKKKKNGEIVKNKKRKLEREIKDCEKSIGEKKDEITKLRKQIKEKEKKKSVLEKEGRVFVDERNFDEQSVQLLMENIACLKVEIAHLKTSADKKKKKGKTETKSSEKTRRGAKAKVKKLAHKPKTKKVSDGRKPTRTTGKKADTKSKAPVEKKKDQMELKKI